MSFAAAFARLQYFGIFSRRECILFIDVGVTGCRSVQIILNDNVNSMWLMLYENSEIIQYRAI